MTDQTEPLTQALPALVEAATGAVRAIDAVRGLPDLPDDATEELTTARDQLDAALSRIGSR